MAFIAKVADYLRRQIELDRRLRQDEAEQAEWGYRIVFENPKGGESYFTYTEDEKTVYVLIKFSPWNHITVFARSLDFWDVPSQKKLSEFEHKKVLNRIVKYASAWGNVSVDTKPVPRREELKAELKEAGIEYEEYEDGIIGFSSTIETEKTRKGGFLRRK